MNSACTIITIGDELLIGQTIDTNSAWIATRLNALGIEVRRRIAVGDTSGAIRAALDEELPRNRLLILTGGLGPTADDITKPLLAEYFGGKLVVDPRVLEHVTEIFRRRNRPMLERNLKQAEVPDSCEVLFNSQGTAPGMWFERDGCIVISLPGVPFEMARIMDEAALPKIASRLQGRAIVHRHILTAGEGESFVAERISDLEAALPAHVGLAYLPAAGTLKLRLTGKAATETSLAAEVELHQQRIAARLENIVIAMDDIPLQEALGRALKEKGLSLGLAESCTGGYIAHLITQIPGASEYLAGGVVCYQNDVKTGILGVQEETIHTHTVISEPVAVEMAAGARKSLGAEIGFGITGLLSGDYEGIPQGTVCMAIVTGDRRYSRSFRFHLDRIRNKELAANAALLLLWQFVNGRI